MGGPDLPRHVLVVGYQRTGRAVATILAARGVRVRATDARTAEALPPLGPAVAGVELRLGEDGAALLDGIDLVVPSPGVPRTAPVIAAAQARGVAVMSEIELAFRSLRCPIVAVTGTNGKSTTTTLVGLALRAAGRRVFVGGNLGTPLVSALADEPEVAVAEVSSFQLEWVERFRPVVACFLNLSPDHLDRHATLAEYRAAKARLFAAQEAGDWAVLNRDDPEVWRLADGLRARVVSFGARAVAEGAFVGEGFVGLRLPGESEERYDLGRMRLTGAHNLENVMAAAVVARLAGAPVDAVQRALDTAEPLPHRFARVAERDGVVWIDDSKATNVGAAASSLRACGGPVVLLAGGLDKGGGYDLLVRAAAATVRRALVFGAARESLAAAFEGAGVAVERVATLEEAVGAAARAARPGDTVLLAPACASFDMFADYAARGRAFRAAVEALP
jgi:UDP-N-acetylmuramoylalanine--D-glutamate ligase